MTFVATLVSNPRAPVLTDALAQRALLALPRPRAPGWLDPGIAVDIVFTPGGQDNLKALEAAVRAALDGAPVDVIVQPKQGRRKKLLTADMDSTMIGQECIDELAAEVGKRDHVAAITERAMRGERVQLCCSTKPISAHRTRNTSIRTRKMRGDPSLTSRLLLAIGLA